VEKLDGGGIDELGKTVMNKLGRGGIYELGRTSVKSES